MYRWFAMKITTPYTFVCALYMLFALFCIHALNIMYRWVAMQIIAPYPDSLVTQPGVNKALKICKT